MSNPHQVLIVDDATFMRTLLKDILVSAAYTVAGEATNGQEAVALYQALKPDLVTMDITMPVKNGLEALREIIQLDPGARIVMCSAMGQQSVVLEALQSGAKDFIVKPFNAERVLNAVEKALSH